MNRRDSLKSILLGLVFGPAALRASPIAAAPVAFPDPNCRGAALKRI